MSGAPLRLGIRPQNPRRPVPPPQKIQLPDPGSSYFTDGRDGQDRWGRPRAKLIMCGEGWDGHVCPAHLEQSCPGERNPGDRNEANHKATCSLDCGSCGGGYRTDEVIATCGQPKGADNLDKFYAERGGSLRLDAWTAPAAPALRDVLPDGWPAVYMPSVESYAKPWLKDLPLAALGTTAQTAEPSRWSARPTLLRKRLNYPEGLLVCTGLVKDDVLELVWDDLDDYLAYLKASGVQLPIAPQFSYYPSQPHGEALYNLTRIFDFYSRCVKAGFPLVGLDYASNVPDWIAEEVIAFVRRSEVKIVAVSLQGARGRGGLPPVRAHALRRLHDRLPKDVAVIVFGVGTTFGQAQVRKLLEGRDLMLSGKEPYARAIFFQLLPNSVSAPAGMTRAEVFKRNVDYTTGIVGRIFDAHDRALAGGKPPGRRRPRRR